MLQIKSIELVDFKICVLQDPVLLQMYFYFLSDENYVVTRHFLIGNYVCIFRTNFLIIKETIVVNSGRA